MRLLPAAAACLFNDAFLNKKYFYSYKRGPVKKFKNKVKIFWKAATAFLFDMQLVIL